MSINVSDVEVGREFYVGTLGLEERTDRPELGVEGTWLNAAGQQVHLILADMPSQQGQHFAVLVDDVGASVEELRGKGLKVSTPVPVGTGLQCFLRDPFGNLIELHEPGGASR